MNKQLENELGLNISQRKFCREFVFDYNATRAYMEAYPKSSTESATVSASNLLSKPNVKAYIKSLEAKTAELAGISRLKIAEEFKKIAFNSVANLHDTWVTRKEFEELTDAEKACISEIQTQLRTSRGTDGKLTEVEYVKIKMYDKTKALDSLNKMFGFNEPEKVEHLGTGLVPIQIGKASERDEN